MILDSPTQPKLQQPKPSRWGGFIDSFGSRGGQLFGCYLLVLVACALLPFDKQTGTELLSLIVGAILRDMQDTGAHAPSKN